MKGFTNVFRKNRPSRQNDHSIRIKKIRSKPKKNTISPDQKKLVPSDKPFEFGPSNQTGSPSGFSYMLAIFLIIFTIIFTMTMIGR